MKYESDEMVGYFECRSLYFPGNDHTYLGEKISQPKIPTFSSSEKIQFCLLRTCRFGNNYQTKPFDNRNKIVSPSFDFNYCEIFQYYKIKFCSKIIMEILYIVGIPHPD